MSRVRISKRGSGAWGILSEGGGWVVYYDITHSKGAIILYRHIRW